MLTFAETEHCRTLHLLASLCSRKQGPHLHKIVTPSP